MASKRHKNWCINGINDKADRSFNWYVYQSFRLRKFLCLPRRLELNPPLNEGSSANATGSLPQMGPELRANTWAVIKGLFRIPKTRWAQSHHHLDVLLEVNGSRVIGSMGYFIIFHLLIINGVLLGGIISHWSDHLWSDHFLPTGHPSRGPRFDLGWSFNPQEKPLIFGRLGPMSLHLSRQFIATNPPVGHLKWWFSKGILPKMALIHL